ncbi:hypothetical protein SIN8267_01247 [Sinobacterium norvegicum]|uniref:Uncharacterized protein n=1 Tax=Sinobacterium norvegicum TaxID=1641715 RepID=A0ABN8EFF1_9GAMM|nr:hypothetical protein [Sinobacterium norvegicum]CAH0991145.1 hypothetical protein SIN8267_01247 [Sinobacterium norvegicum]
MKSHDIEEFVSQFAELSVQENKGGRFKISHCKLKNQAGSLWFRAYSEKYRLYPTGEVISLLNLHSKLGSPDGQDMERDYWFTQNLTVVKDIITNFSEIKI